MFREVGGEGEKPGWRAAANSLQPSTQVGLWEGLPGFTGRVPLAPAELHPDAGCGPDRVSHGAPGLPDPCWPHTDFDKQNVYLSFILLVKCYADTSNFDFNMRLKTA